MTTAVATQFLPVVAAAGVAQNRTVVSLHDIAPSSQVVAEKIISELAHRGVRMCSLLDRKSTRLNSSHRCISYAVFCLTRATLPFTLSLHDALPISIEN